MKIELDTHTHTLASGHAYNTITEMIDAAVEKGLKLLAITEHAPAMPGSCKDFYFYNLKILISEGPGADVWCGIKYYGLYGPGRSAGAVYGLYGPSNRKPPSAVHNTGVHRREYGGHVGRYS